MGWIQVINLNTNEIELEVGKRPNNQLDDEKVCEFSGVGLSTNSDDKDREVT